MFMSMVDLGIYLFAYHLMVSLCNMKDSWVLAQSRISHAVFLTRTDQSIIYISKLLHCAYLLIYCPFDVFRNAIF